MTERRKIERTLGWVVIDWIEQNLVHGPGDVQGQPIVIDEELAYFILGCYELHPDGRRKVDRAFLSRPKGRAKSELAGMLACAEALAPVRFDRWASNGEPIGRPVTSPYIRCLATEETQAGNTYDNVVVMLRHLADTNPDYSGIDVGLTRTYLPGGGVIVPSTASNAAKDGGKETFTTFDEALALDTPLPTPSGWTTMGEVRPGDRLIGSDGLPTTVVKVTPPQDDRICWRVTFSDGTSVIATDGHLWATKVASSAALPRIRTTGEMAADGRRFRVPRGTGWKSSDVDHLPLDPYLLGLWLGDGDSRAATISTGEVDREAITTEIERRGFRVTRCATRPDRAALLYVSVEGAVKGRFSPVKSVKTVLREQGLLENKHIPQAYLRAGSEQRAELLRGLMDSDGSITPNGHAVFTSTSQQLADDVTELLRSLGQVVGRGYQSDSRARSGGTYRVWFTPYRLLPFSIERKASRVRDARKGPEWVTIRSIDPVASVPVRCVAVDATDHLFRAGAGWHLTHNTHLYVLPELKKMHATVRRNMGKRKLAEPWSLETSTMYQPGEGSVAEATHRYAQEIAEGRRKDAALLFDHKEAPPFDWKDDKHLREALIYVYGPAAEWMDIDRIIREIRDPQNDEAESRRFWLNQVVQSTEQAFDVNRWRALAEPRDVPEGDLITLGFDGARFDDATALIGTHVESGHQFVLGIWERPPGVDDWEVDEQDVAEAVDQAFSTWEVWRFYADPPYWETKVNEWAGIYGDKRVISWHTARVKQAAYMVRAYISAIRAGDLTHDGNEAFTRHIGNARKRLTRMTDEDGRRLFTLTKEHRGSPNKIDAAMAGALSWEARQDAIAAGVKRKRKARAMSF